MVQVFMMINFYKKPLITINLITIRKVISIYCFTYFTQILLKSFHSFRNGYVLETVLFFSH